MENIAIENRIIELRDKVKEQENQLEHQRHYLVSNHRGVYYCFKLIRNSHWVSYIGVPEYVEVRTGEKDKDGLFLYNQIYLVDYCHPEEDYRGIELGHCPVYWIPSEVTYIGCGMNVEINSKVPVHWMGFDYAHLHDMNLEEAQEILKDWDVNFKDDIENISSINESIDICYHLAAKARVQPSFDDPVDYFRVNVKGTMEVMEWAKKNNVKVVYAGSSSKHFSPEDSPYAMYKYLGEQICRLYKKSYNIKVEIARFYNVYGPRENRDEKFGNVIGIWTTKAIKGEPLPIVGDGMQRRDFTHVNDIVDGLIKIGFSDISQEDGWELGTGNNYSVNELFEMFKLRFNAKSVSIPDQPGNYKKTLRKNNKLLDLLGWDPKDRLANHIKNLNV